jgi:hypothetical protein
MSTLATAKPKSLRKWYVIVALGIYLTSILLPTFSPAIGVKATLPVVVSAECIGLIILVWLSKRKGEDRHSILASAGVYILCNFLVFLGFSIFAYLILSVIRI